MKKKARRENKQRTGLIKAAGDKNAEMLSKMEVNVKLHSLVADEMPSASYIVPASSSLKYTNLLSITLTHLPQTTVTLPIYKL